MIDRSSGDSQLLGQIFFRRVQELGETTFVRLQRKGRFEEVSWNDFGAMVRGTLLGLYSLGLRKGERVGILSENRLEWLCADIATLAGGLPNVIVSPRLSENMILKVFGNSRPRAVFVEDESGAGRLLNLKGQLPFLDYLIVMDSMTAPLPNAIDLDELLRRGRRGEDNRIGEIMESIHPEDLATIMYTSGSTGEPKGVMRTQKNMLSNITCGMELTLSKPDELFVIVLSLNHLLGRFGFLKSAVTGRSTAIVESTELEVDLKAIQVLSPTAMTLVPRVMQRILAGLLADVKIRNSWEAIEELEQTKEEAGALGADQIGKYDELRSSLRKEVSLSLGGRIKYISYSGAPMAPRIMRFFEVAGIPLIGSYGSTECGGVSLSGLKDNRPGSCGKPFPNVEVRIAGDGEILVRGPTVTPGYFENPQATAEALDSEGWFHTGDLGLTDPDGSLRIIGRKKDVFYCTDGSNIYPGYIELLLENDPFIRQGILLGDHLPFMAALIVPERARMAAELKKEEESLASAEIERLLWSRIEIINGQLEEVEKIRKIAVIERDFSERVRSVTAFQKIKVDRKAVAESYRQEIARIYQAA